MNTRMIRFPSVSRTMGLSILVMGFLYLVSGTFPTVRAEEKPGNVYNEQALMHMTRALILEDQGNFAQAILEYQDALSYDSTAAIFYKEMGKNYLRLGKNKNSVDAFEKYLTMEPRDLEVHHILAEIFKQVHDFKKAEWVMERMRWMQLWPPTFYYDLLQIYLINEKDKKAADLSRELIKRFNEDESGESMAGAVRHIYQVTENIPAGISLFEQLILDVPENALFRHELGDLYLAMGDSVRAMHNFQEAVSRQPELTPAQEKLADIYLKRNQPEEALKRFDYLGLEHRIRIAYGYFMSEADSIAVPLFQDIMKNYPDNFTPYFYLGVMSFHRGESEKAQGYLTKAIELDSTQSILYFYAGRAFLSVDNEKAKNYLKKAIELDSVKIDFYYLLGVSQYQLKEYEGAEESVRKALSLEPDDIRSLTLYSDVLYSQGKFNAAEEMYIRVLTIDSTNVMAMNNYSYMLAEQGVKLEKALELSKKAVEQLPGNQSYLDTLGWIYYRLGNYEYALHFLLKAIETDTVESSIIYDHLGDTYYKMGQEEQAKQYWRKVLELDGENSSVRQKLNEDNEN